MWNAFSGRKARLGRSTALVAGVLGALALSVAPGAERLVGLAGPASAQACTAEQFADAVDQSGANLRKILQETQPRLDAKLKQLKAAKGWSDTESEEKLYAALSDARMQALERQANELLERVDSLGQVSGKAAPDCARLQALEAAGLELQAAVRAKATYTLARIDTLLGAGTAPATASEGKAASPPAASAGATAKTPPPAAVAAAPQAPAPKPQQSAAAAPPVASVPPPAAANVPPPLPAPSPPSSAAGAPPSWSTTTTVTAGSDEGFTVDEIMLASTGFFGKVSAGLGGIIEHAFSSVGRPTGYILGTEGGGAFLAGLRYGSGTLYMRAGQTMPIHWHGPSVGYDIGAAGAKVMFLIYRLREPEQMHNAFTGVEGSAFVVGGVGFTMLTNGDVQMAPIRSGIGLRVGASLGYLRFTKKPTWNPF